MEATGRISALSGNNVETFRCVTDIRGIRFKSLLDSICDGYLDEGMKICL